jgi:hypothetical protein
MSNMPPPKKPSGCLRVAAIGGAIIAALVIIILVVFVVQLRSVETGPPPKISGPRQPYEERVAPREVTEGQEFTVGSHKTLAGWQVEKDTLTGEAMFVITNVQATNVSAITSTAFIHFKMINAKGKVLGNVECFSADLEPGQTQDLTCIPDGKWGKFTKITVEATF